MTSSHPFGLCRRVHLADGPEAAGCVACACAEEKRRTGKSRTLCAACVELAKALNLPHSR